MAYFAVQEILENAPKGVSSQRFTELDALRGLAALGVVIFHYTSIYSGEYRPDPPALFEFPWGNYGVHLFFMISGFVIFMTLEKTKHPMDFIVSRFSRLYPAYWAAVIVTYVIVKFSSFSQLKVPAKHAVFNLSMVQDWFHLLRVDGVYWTLTIELSFYVLMFTLFLVKGLKHIEALGLIWLVLMMANERLAGLLPWHVPDAVAVTNLLVYGHLFFAGILFYNLRMKGHTWQRYAALALCLAVEFLVNEIAYGGPAVAILFGVFYLFITGRLGWLAQKPLVYLGIISYTLYLTHQYIGYVIIDYLFGFNVNAWVRLIVPLMCALLIASAITYGVERPAMEYIRKRYKSWRTP